MKDLTGQCFGRLTVLKFSHKKGCHYYWECLCVCGKHCVVDGWNLKSGNSKSCGCFNQECRRERLLIHGKGKSKLYHIWDAMKRRCLNTEYNGYKNYGGRGITICQEWQDDFINFYNWAINNGYDDKAKRGVYTLDRIDVNGNYEPSNCRWVTIKEQQSNKQNTIRITFNNETHTIKEWAKKTGISYAALHGRFKKGWDCGKALTTPMRNIQENEK